MVHRKQTKQATVEANRTTRTLPLPPTHQQRHTGRSQNTSPICYFFQNLHNERPPKIRLQLRGRLSVPATSVARVYNTRSYNTHSGIANIAYAVNTHTDCPFRFRKQANRDITNRNEGWAGEVAFPRHYTKTVVPDESTSSFIESDFRNPKTNFAPEPHTQSSSSLENGIFSRFPCPTSVHDPDKEQEAILVTQHDKSHHYTTQQENKKTRESHLGTEPAGGRRRTWPRLGRRSKVSSQKNRASKTPARSC